MSNPAQFGRIAPEDWAQYPDYYTLSIWGDKLSSNPADYGSNSFHGRTHPDIIRVALERYTKPGDVVWDCFAGSGTTLDVCHELDNVCIANDLNSCGRDDIILADSRLWNPKIELGLPADLVICHPPYMDVIDYGDEQLSTDNLSQYKRSMGMVFDQVREALRPGHVLVVIVGTVYKGDSVICLDYELMTMLQDFRLLGRVVRSFGETKGGVSNNKNANLWKYRRLKYGLWELGQDVVLFLQRRG